MLRIARHSRYMNGRAPRVCACPDCERPLDGTAHRGHSGMYYCSQLCRSEMNDDLRPEDVARYVS